MLARGCTLLNGPEPAGIQALLTSTSAQLLRRSLIFSVLTAEGRPVIA